MTIEERLTKLEYHIRNFNIVVVGDAIVFAEFGKLPKSSDTSERISNLEKSIADFSMVGDATIEVSGTFDEGYSIR